MGQTSSNPQRKLVKAVIAGRIDRATVTLCLLRNYAMLGVLALRVTMEQPCANLYVTGESLTLPSCKNLLSS